jgi:myo-inositol 2-dehydrogenase/D-chiro-inositol 1-dehydrogenase
MSTRPLRYGLIGAGMMGREHIRNLALIPGSELVAIADPTNEQVALSIAEAEKHLKQTPRGYADHRAMLAPGGIDAVVIASPNDTHIHVLEDLMTADRPVGILVEKPVVTSLADCDRLQARAKNYPAPIWVAMEYRYMPPVAELRRAVKAGEIGTMRMFAIREHRFPFL